MKKNAFDYVWTDKKRSLFGLPLTFTRYYLTESKFITRTGFLSIDEDEIDLYKITDKKVKYPFFQRLFNCGTIIIYSRDADTIRHKRKRYDGLPFRSGSLRRFRRYA